MSSTMLLPLANAEFQDCCVRVWPKRSRFQVGLWVRMQVSWLPTTRQFPTTTPAKVREMWPEIDLASLSNSQVYLPKFPCGSLSIQSWPTGACCLYPQLSTLSRGRRGKYPQRGWTVFNSYLSLSRSITPPFLVDLTLLNMGLSFQWFPSFRELNCSGPPRPFF